MVSAEREPIMGLWGPSPQRGRGAKPLVRGQSPLEAETLLAFGRSMEAANLPTFLKSRNTENHRHLYCLANVATLPSPFTFIHHVAICGLWKGTLSSQSKILLFDALQLYYRRLARCLVFRPSVRPSMGHGCIVAKRCKIGPRLILITNRKPYRLFQVI